MITKTYKRINIDGYFIENVLIALPETLQEALEVGLDVDEVNGTFDASSLVLGLVEEEIPEGIVRALWDGTRWIEGNRPDLSNFGFPDWPKLQSILRGSVVFGKAMMTANTNAWSLLLFALGTSHSLDDLNFAISQVRTGMSSDFTTSEIEFINTALFESGFDLQVN